MKKECNTCKILISVINLLNGYKALVGCSASKLSDYGVEEKDDCPYPKEKCQFNVYDKCYTKDSICELYKKNKTL